jgi:hypothetical protein
MDRSADARCDRPYQVVAKADGLRGNAAWAGHSVHAAPMQAPGQDGLAARMLLVRRTSR